MEENIKSLYLKIKDNIVLIAFIPSLLGGIWQLIKLAQISPNMIRFFSISQLVSDGLLILLFILIPLISLIPVLLSLHPPKYDFFKQKTPFDNIFRWIMYPLTFILLIVYLTETNLNSTYGIVKFFFSISLFYGILYYLLQANFKNIFGKYFSLSIIFIINMGLSFYIFYRIDNNEKNIVNFKNLILKIEQKDCYSKKPTILYFNDEYIFIEVFKNNNKEIIIEQFDSLFEK